MEAKDTIMGRVKVNRAWKEMGLGSNIPKWASYGEEHPTYKLLKAQAEISFKAGQEEEIKGGHNAISYLARLMRENSELKRRIAEYEKEKGNSI